MVNAKEEQTTPVSVRMPVPVYNRIKHEAGRERRSMNSQIVKMLERALPAENEKAETAPTVPAE